jgi:hypothetical protein
MKYPLLDTKVNENNFLAHEMTEFGWVKKYNIVA